MTLPQLVALKPASVRHDENKMRLYIDFYTGVFGFAPNCAPCTFSTDFNKLKKAVLTGATVEAGAKKTKAMSTVKKYVLNRGHQNDILTYRKKDGRPVRTYGHGITDEFAADYLKHGTKKELEERAKKFDVVNGEATSKEAKKAQASQALLDKETKAGAAKNTKAKTKTASTAAGTPDAGTTDAGTTDAGTPDAGTPEAGTPEAPPLKGTPMYDPKVIKYAGRDKVDELLADNMLDPKAYPELADAKKALTDLTN